MITNTVLRQELHRHGEEMDIVGVFVESMLTDGDAERRWEHWLVADELAEYLALGSDADRETYLGLLIESLADEQRALWMDKPMNRVSRAQCR